MDVLDIIQEMLEEGFSQEEAQFIAADRCFGGIAYADACTIENVRNVKEAD